VNSPVPPKRRFELVITISGDEWDDVEREIDMIHLHILDHGKECRLASGGYSSGCSVDLTERPEQTHDAFIAELNAYIETLREEKTAGGEA